MAILFFGLIKESVSSGVDYTKKVDITISIVTRDQKLNLLHKLALSQTKALFFEVFVKVLILELNSSVSLLQPTEMESVVN